MKMTAFTDSEYTYLHELDSDGIKERVEKTTGGEWILDNESDDRPYIADIWFDGEENGHVEIHRYGAAVESYDAEFIAHARQDVPALIAEVERLRAFEKQAVYALEENQKLRTENEQLHEKMEEIERDKFIWEASRNQLHRTVEYLREENARLREALRFYANEKTYMQMSSEEPPDIWSDDGSIAREALGGEQDE